jgi:hypothetical protein
MVIIPKKYLLKKSREVVMSNDLTVSESREIALSDVMKMADIVAKSGLFGTKTSEQAAALMLLCQAEGMHPMIAARDYDIIQGKPAKKAVALLAAFQAAGGSVVWHEYTDSKVSATFSHPQGGSLAIEWNLDMARKAGFADKDTWKKFPRQMLSARVISEGVRKVFPAATSNLYVPEEIQDFDDKPIVTHTVTENKSKVDALKAKLAPAEPIVIEAEPIVEPVVEPPVEVEDEKKLKRELYKSLTKDGFTKQQIELACLPKSLTDISYEEFKAAANRLIDEFVVSVK